MLTTVSGWVAAHPEISLLIFAGAWLASLSLALMALVRLGGLARGQKTLISGLHSGDLERLLRECLTENKALFQRLDEGQRADAALSDGLAGTFQRSAVVRFDAVAGVAGKQSFSVALLDARGNGIVLSTLQTRQDVRIFVKEIAAGNSLGPLTDEERLAVAQARAKD